MRKIQEQVERGLTTFLVTKSKQPIRNVGTSVLSEHQQVFVGRKQNPHLLFDYRLRDLSNTNEIIIFIEGILRKQRVRLPEKIQKKLIEYFQVQANKNPSFDCGYFVHFLYDIPYNGFLNENIWNFSDFNVLKSLKPGDVILISEKTLQSLKSKHMAIYLGHGIYISKYGRGIGNVTFANLNDMLSMFNGNIVEKLTVKQ